MAHARPSRIITVSLLVLILALGLAARTVAQSGEALVTILAVKSQAFPGVTVSVVVADESGPRDGLTAADFRLSEDGVAIPSASVAVERDASQGWRLILALDVSMNPDSLAEVKEAAKSFVDTLEPRDKMAIIAFHDEVEVVLGELTNNQEVLKAAIDGLAAGGNHTTLNEAIFEAVTRVGALPSGRKAVLVLTNSANNIGTRSPDEVIAKARAVHTPIYAIGFGRAKPDVLDKIASSTGGRPFVVSGLDEVGDSFQAIGGLLGQGGYKVTFRSGLKADGAEHELIVGVAYQGKEGQAEGRFVAVPGQVTVNLPGLSEGQTVGGQVKLAVEARAPAPVAWVEYRLDDRVLAELTAPPYDFEWDTTSLEPGTYRLTARVVDQAGNEGQVEVSLNVARPVVVTVSSAPTEVTIGDQVSVEAQVEALAEVAHVEFLLDGESIGLDDTPPYDVTFDSSAYPPGEYHLTVRAEDRLGRKAETSLTVAFVTPPVSPLKTFWFGLTGWIGWPQILMAGDVVVFLVGLVLIARIQKRRRRKTYGLEIANLGNVGSHYHLRAEEPTGALEFRFRLKGGPILPQLLEVAETPGAGAGAVVRGSGAVPAFSPPGPAGAPGGGVRQTAGQVKQTANFVTSLASSIGALLPGSLGASVRGAVQPVYRVQSKVQSTKSRASRVSSLSGRLTGARPSVSAGGSTAQPTGAWSRPPTAPLAEASPPVGTGWVQTPLVAPGETLRLDLLIIPSAPDRTRDYAFKVVSRPEGQENRVVVAEGSVQVVKPSWFRRLLPYLILTLVMVMGMLAIAMLW